MVLPHIQEGDFCIDATSGNGLDTEFLCKTAGKSGFVLGIDIQKTAIEKTGERLKSHCPCYSYSLIQGDHRDLAQQAENHGRSKEKASCIMFNLGYLPGTDHKVSTKKESTLAALSSALLLLKKGGILSICIYSGKDSGFEEKEAVLSWLKTLDSRQYLVILAEYYNRPNNPPLPAFVIKL